MKKLVILICCLLLFLSCASIMRTRVSSKEIQDINCHLEMNDKIVHGIYPSIETILKIDVIENSGKIISNPAIEDLMTVVSDPKIQLTDKWNKMLLLPRYKDFLSLLHQDYSFTLNIKVNENPFPGKDFVFTLDPSLFTEITYEAEFSFSYVDDSSGVGLIVNILDMITTDVKEDGQKGRDGGVGNDGDDLKIITAYYDVHDIENRGFEENTLLLIYEANKKDLYFTTADTITISTIGGKGSSGEYGESGENGGNGGDGEKGGDGGNGGNIELYLYDDLIDITYNIQLNSEGGNGGEGGRGGSGVSDEPETNGNNGRSGRKGMPGIIRHKKISFDDTLRILKGISNPYFDLSRIVEIPFEDKINTNGTYNDKESSNNQNLSD